MTYLAFVDYLFLQNLGLHYQILNSLEKEKKNTVITENGFCIIVK